MKRITFKSYKKPIGGDVLIRNNRYTVLVRREIKMYKNHEHIKKFLTESSLFFTHKLYTATGLFVQIQKIYWENWMYFDIKTNKSKNRFMEGQKIQDTLKSFVLHLERSVIESPKESGINYVIQRFDHMYNDLMSIMQDIEPILPQNQTSTKYQIRVLRSQLKTWKFQLDQFGKKDTQEIVPDLDFDHEKN